MASHFARWTCIHNNPRINRLSESLIASALSLNERRRTRYLAARTLLAEMMMRIYGISQLPALRTSPAGRPAFEDRELPDFSIAYAGNVIGVLIADEGGRAGLDLEILRVHSRQAQEQHARDTSSAEKAWIQAQSDPDEAAAQLWAIRQSVLKLTGEVESQGDALRLHPASGRLRSLAVPDVQALSDVESLMIWSCALSPESERLHLWEYDGEDGWHLLRKINQNKQESGPRMLRLTSLPPEKALHP